MPIAQGVAKQIRFKRQTAKGSLASTSGGQVLRRNTANFELAKETYDTASEITTRRQLISSRHGVKIVNGSYDGILSTGTFSDMLGALLMRDFSAVPSITAASITIAGSGPTYTLTRAAGSFLTDGIKVGMVVRLTAGTFNVANANKNLLVSNVTALVLTVMVLNGSSLVPEGPVTGATIAVPGKVTYVPETGHTNVYYTVESWYPDIAVSERNLDVKITQADISLPGTGNGGIQLTAIGLDQSKDTTAHFNNPTAETTTEALVAASGLLLVNGVAQGVVTDLKFTANGNGNAADGVVGTDIRPDVFMGKLMVTGSFTAYFDGGTIPDLFINESDVSILSALAAGSSANADFMTIFLPKLNVNSSSPDDNETGLKRTYNFTCEFNAAGGAALATPATTIQIQDSQAA